MTHRNQRKRRTDILVNKGKKRTDMLNNYKKNDKCDKKIRRNPPKKIDQIVKKVSSKYINIDLPLMPDALIVIGNYLLDHSEVKKKSKWAKDDNQSFEGIYPLLNEKLMNLMDFETEIKYMDVGAGDGRVTYLNEQVLENYYYLPVSSYVMDLEDAVQVEEWDYQFTTEIPNQLDFITCKVSLHHINYAPDLIQSFSTSGAKYVLIREHDVVSEDDFEAVSLEHYLYHIFTEGSIVDNIENDFEKYKVNDPKFNKEDVYRSRQEWVNLFTNYKSIWTNHHYNQNPWNANNIYMELFELI